MQQLQYIHAYEHFCNDVSLDVARNHIKTMSLIFQKNVDVRAAYAQIHSDCPFIDWDQVDNIKAYKGYKDTATWVHITQFFSMKVDDQQWRAFVHQHKIFAHFVVSLASAKLDLSPLHTAQLFLLLNVTNLQAMNVIEMFYSMLFDKAVQREALLFFSVLANIPFDKKDRTDAIVALLRDCLDVNVKQFDAEIELQRSRESKLSQIFKQKHIQATTLRPRLRSKIKHDALQGSALATLDGFKPWCDTIRFPNVFSMSHKKRLYFTMSQTHVDFGHYIPVFVQEADLGQVILQYHVKNPDIDVLTDTILQTRIVSEPFAELHLFRTQCFGCFSVQQKSMLRLNDLLHLYMAAYQPASVWKSVWKAVFPVLSIQIIKDIEVFVQNNPINHNAVMNILFADVKQQ